MRIYLCSRVAADAHAYNNLVAAALKALGHEVFVPHLAEYNEREGASESEIFRQDFTQMLEADACVVVGRVGIDCAWEMGWFSGSGKPIYWVLSYLHEKTSPMLNGIRRIDSVTDLKETLNGNQRAG